MHKKKIGILLTGHLPEAMQDEYHGHNKLFEQLLSQSGFQFQNYPVVDHFFPNSIHAADGWLITGSRHGTYENLPWIKTLELFIQKAYAQNIPMIGICFGHQILAQALGGKVEKFTGGWNIGVKNYHVDSIGKNLNIVAWHQDQVIVKPDDAKTICTTDFCKYAGFSYKNKAFSLQPHPEFTNKFLQDLYKIRKDTLSQETREQILHSMDQQTTNDPIAQYIIHFFKTM